MGAPHNWSFVGTGTPRQSEPVNVPRGRVVGGTSAINGQVFLRGVPEDYDNWASWGNDEWSYINVLPYFRKQETDTDISDDFHGFDGPIPVRRHRRENWLPLQEAFRAGLRRRGLRRGVRPQQSRFHRRRAVPDEQPQRRADEHGADLRQSQPTPAQLDHPRQRAGAAHTV